MPTKLFKGNFTQVPNELLEEMARGALSKTEIQVFLAIIRQSFGFHRQSVKISIREISSKTKVQKSHVSESLKKLTLKKFITSEKARGTKKQTIKIIALENTNRVLQKETFRKKECYVPDSGTLSSGKRNATPSALNKSSNKDLNKKQLPKNSNGINEFINYFLLSLKERLGEPPVSFSRGLAGRGFSELLKSYDQNEIYRRIGCWFSSRDTFIQKNSYRESMFFKYFNRLKEGPINEENSGRHNKIGRFRSEREGDDYKNLSRKISVY